jgi:hypothetical protein
MIASKHNKFGEMLQASKVLRPPLTKRHQDPDPNLQYVFVFRPCPLWNLGKFVTEVLQITEWGYVCEPLINFLHYMWPMLLYQVDTNPLPSMVLQDTF